MTAIVKLPSNERKHFYHDSNYSLLTGNVSYRGVTIHIPCYLIRQSKSHILKGSGFWFHNMITH